MSGVTGWLGSIENDPLANYYSLENNARVQELGRLLGLPLLPRHLHEIIFFALAYAAIYTLSGPILRGLTPWYKRLPKSVQAGVKNHVVSEVNAIVLCLLSFPLFFSPKLDSLVSYTPYAGLVISICVGYFIFDLYITTVWFKDNGLGFAIHAVAALFVFAQGMRPFMYSFAAPFIWFEASTPFVNLHWLATNVPSLVYPRTQTINGALLIMVFFLCRIIPGPYNGYRLFREALSEDLPGVPASVVLVVLSCYLFLTLLNFFWFGKMIHAAISILSGKGLPGHEPSSSKLPTKTTSTKATTATSSDANKSVPSRRKRKV